MEGVALPRVSGCGASLPHLWCGMPHHRCGISNQRSSTGFMPQVWHEYTPVWQRLCARGGRTSHECPPVVLRWTPPTPPRSIAPDRVTCSRVLKLRTTTSQKCAAVPSTRRRRRPDAANPPQEHRTRSRHLLIASERARDGERVSACVCV